MNFTEAELRLLGVSAPILLRMLKAREDRIVGKMYGAFRNGTTDHLASIAELACIRDLANELNNAIGQLENLKE